MRIIKFNIWRKIISDNILRKY